MWRLVLGLGLVCVLLALGVLYAVIQAYLLNGNKRCSCRTGMNEDERRRRRWAGGSVSKTFVRRISVATWLLLACLRGTA